MSESKTNQPWIDLPLDVRTDSVMRMLKRRTVALADPDYMAEYERKLRDAMTNHQTEVIEKLKADLVAHEQITLRQHPEIAAMIELQAQPIAQKQSLSDVTEAVTLYAQKYIAPRLIPPPNRMESFVPPTKTSFHIG